MAKKSLAEKFRAFLDAAPAQSNQPMTKGEIAKEVAKKKRKAATKKRTAAKKNVARKTASKKSTKAKKSKR